MTLFQEKHYGKGKTRDSNYYYDVPNNTNNCAFLSACGYINNLT